MMKRILTVWLVLLITFLFSTTVFAHEIPDLDEIGTITLTMDWDGTPLDGGKLSMYRIGDIAEENGNYSFVLISRLQDFDLSLENVNDPELAAELAQIAEAEALAEISAPIENGKAVFTDVVSGLYLVLQKDGDATEGFECISPFLISMPQNENGEYITQITADPKVPIEPIPPVETPPDETPPDDPDLPQTGQLNWPVPLLAVMGLLLFAAGWWLCYGYNKENKENHEK